MFQSGDPNAFCLDTTCFGAYLIDVVSVAVAVSRRLVRPQLMMVGGEGGVCIRVLLLDIIWVTSRLQHGWIAYGVLA